MWQPEPGWQRLPGSGPSTMGIWRAQDHGRDVVVKRLQAPRPQELAESRRPDSQSWWRREADVALDGRLISTRGLRAAEVLRVEEDPDGITLTSLWVESSEVPTLFRARALGRFAGNRLPGRAWMARDQLRSRIGAVARREGWRTLARTSVADVADHLWTRRESFLAQLDTLPQVPVHGDPSGANLRGLHGFGPDADVVAIDWAQFGLAAVGTDLAHLMLTAKEGFEPLLEAYLDGLPDGVASPTQVVLGARITAVFMALTRADWALARVAEGEGALAGKFRHPAVAPHLLVLQRQFGHLEALVG